MGNWESWRRMMHIISDQILLEFKAPVCFGVLAGL